MARYTVTLYASFRIRMSMDYGPLKLTPVQVEASDCDDAQAQVIRHCEDNGVKHGNIVSIVKQQESRPRG